jgi:Diguanylate cyclase, GGDEF domain
VSDLPDDPKPPAAAATKPRRSRKFVLPDDHHDDRTTTRIEAFIDGPAQPQPSRPDPRPQRERRPVELDTRPDWLNAFRYEAARHARYGRPVSLLLVELPGGQGEVAYDRMAGQFTEVIRSEARDPDRAVRIGRSRFLLLLPETSATSAEAASARLQRAFTAMQSRSSAFRPALWIEIASPGRSESLEDALALAERRLKV